MSASSVSLFPDDADSARTYLAVTQTALSNHWIRITRGEYAYIGKIIFHSDQEGLKEQFDVKKTETEKSRAIVPLQRQFYELFLMRFFPSDHFPPIPWFIS